MNKCMVMMLLMVSSVTIKAEGLCDEVKSHFVNHYQLEKKSNGVLVHEKNSLSSTKNSIFVEVNDEFAGKPQRHMRMNYKLTSLEKGSAFFQVHLEFDNRSFGGNSLQECSRLIRVFIE